MKQNEKPKQGIPRLLEISGEKNTYFVTSVLFSMLGALCQLVPFLSIYQVMAELLRHTATGEALNTDFVIRWAFYGLAGLIAGYALTYAGGMMAHTFAYRTICSVRLKVAEHIGKLPMGYVTNNSIGKTKQVLDADIEQMETFIVPVGLLLFLKNPDDVAFAVTFLFFLILGPAAAAPTLKLRSFSESINVITESVKRVDEILNEKPLPEPIHNFYTSKNGIAPR